MTTAAVFCRWGHCQLWHLPTWATVLVVIAGTALGTGAAYFAWRGQQR